MSPVSARGSKWFGRHRGISYYINSKYHGRGLELPILFELL